MQLAEMSVPFSNSPLVVSMAELDDIPTTNDMINVDDMPIYDQYKHS